MEQKKRRGKASETERKEKGGVERDEAGDCAMPHTLEAQSPLETVAALDHGMTVKQ